MKRIILALIVLAAFPGAISASVPASAAAAAPPPSQDYTHPLVMQQVGNEVATAKVAPAQPATRAPTAPALSAVGALAAPRREVFGFALGSSLNDATIGYPSWNFSFLTTVAYFGLHVTDAGIFASDSGATVWNTQSSTFISAAHAAGTKVVLTIILQDFSNNTPHMCAGLANRSTTASLTAGQVAQKGVDGVNIDYEGLNTACPNGQSARSMMTDLAHQMRTAMPSAYISVDTYASSAGDPSGFFDVPGMSPYVDSYFVMAYDAEYANYYHYPTQCPTFCLGPTAPLTGYYYNDATDMAQYLNVVPASKVILGVPYYGRKACVTSATPNAYPAAGASVTADGYRDASREATAAGVQPGSYGAHRDAHSAGQERWDIWYSTTLNCTRELYWDDTTSLGLKYDLVNQDGLRGVGIWNLNFGGGQSELWRLLAAKFSTTTPWTSLGGGLTSVPESSSWGASREDVFIRGNDGALWHNSWDGTQWVGWNSLGGVIAGDPGAVSWGPGRIDAFARGSDNALWHRYFDGTAWSGWESLGGTLNSGVEVTSWGPGRLDIFAIAPDRSLIHMYWGGTGWSSWERLGGYLSSDAAAVAWAPGRIDIFARGAEYATWHRYWAGSGWSGWESLGGYITSAPAVSSCTSGHLDVFANAGDGATWHTGWNGAQWVPWESLGGLWTSGPGAVCRPGATSVDLFARGGDNGLWHTTVAPF